MKLLQNKNARISTAYAIAFALIILGALLGVLLGSTHIGLSDIWRALTFSAPQSPESRIFWYVRFPRTCASLICGAALAVSGAVIQGVLANKLASPSIIGVNAGAGLAVTACCALGILGGWQLSLFSFLGAFLTVMAVSVGARKWGASRGTVILIGVALNSLLGAFSDVLTTLDPELRVMSGDFKIGDFSAVTYSKLIPAAVVIILSLFCLFTLSGTLDVLTLGEENARGLGLNTKAARFILLMLSALLSGAAVSVVGLLSFVGLLVPHAVRRLCGGSARTLLPLCAVFGAGFVSLCDTFARTLFAPYEIPVGIIMAFLGAPFFIFILVKGKGGVEN